MRPCCDASGQVRSGTLHLSANRGDYIVWANGQCNSPSRPQLASQPLWFAYPGVVARHGRSSHCARRPSSVVHLLVCVVPACDMTCMFGVRAHTTEACTLSCPRLLLGQATTGVAATCRYPRRCVGTAASLTDLWPAAATALAPLRPTPITITQLVAHHWPPHPRRMEADWAGRPSPPAQRGLPDPSRAQAPKAAPRTPARRRMHHGTSRRFLHGSPGSSGVCTVGV